MSCLRIKSIFKEFSINFLSEEKDDTLSAISGGSLKPDMAAGQTVTSNIIITTPTMTTSSLSGNPTSTAAHEVDEDGYSIKPASENWEKNESPRKG